MKKLLCCFLCLSLLALSTLGESIPRARGSLDVDALMRYDSWTEERNGDFFVSGDGASQLESAYRERADRNGLSDALMFEMGLEGNKQTGVAYPVLRVLYTGRTAASPRALLITLEDTTCVFPLNAEARTSARMKTGTGKVINDDMRAAVLRAQKRYGLLETGYADAQLLNLLSGVTTEGTTPEAPEAYVYTQTAEKANFSLKRWWTASGVDTTQTGSLKTVADADNVLLLADGVIQNRSTEALSLSWDVSATCTYDGQWSFPANVYCEKNGGESFAGTLGILSRARLVVACEVPAYLLEEGNAWTLTLKLGEEAFSFELLP